MFKFKDSTRELQVALSCIGVEDGICAGKATDRSHKPKSGAFDNVVSTSTTSVNQHRSVHSVDKLKPNSRR